MPEPAAMRIRVARFIRDEEHRAQSGPHVPGRYTKSDVWSHAIESRSGRRRPTFHAFRGPTSRAAREYGIRSAQEIGATAVTIHLHVDDADAVIARCIAAGATLEREAADAFYGERSGVVRDPFGHRWNIGHHTPKT